jgi:ribosome modulation factor
MVMANRPEHKAPRAIDVEANQSAYSIGWDAMCAGYKLEQCPLSGADWILWRNGWRDAYRFTYPNA